MFALVFVGIYFTSPVRGHVSDDVMAVWYNTTSPGILWSIKSKNGDQPSDGKSRLLSHNFSETNSGVGSDTESFHACYRPSNISSVWLSDTSGCTTWSAKSGFTNIPASALWRLANGRPSREEKAEKQRYLTDPEEKALKDFCSTLRKKRLSIAAQVFTFSGLPYHQTTVFSFLWRSSRQAT